MLRNPRFNNIVRLNLSSNQIVSIDGEFCKNLPNVQQLDLRANQIREISTHIKAMVGIKVLKLDKNELTRLPEELYDIRILEELTFQQNRVEHLSPKIGQLVELKKLNIASNMIPKIPEEIGRCEELQTLCIQNNRFASFPCSFSPLLAVCQILLLTCRGITAATTAPAAPSSDREAERHRCQWRSSHRCQLVLSACWSQNRFV